jgi:hypothetical protein
MSDRHTPTDGYRAKGTTSHRRAREVFQECQMSHWRNSTARADVMRGTGEDEAAYVAGWTLSGLATLATILAVWVFAI